MRKNIVFALVLIMLFIPISCFAWTEIGLYARYSGYNNRQSCTDSGYFNYANTSPSASYGFYYLTLQSGVDTSNSFAYSISTTYKYDLTAQKTYDVKITFNGNDVRKALNSSTVELEVGDTCQSVSSYNNQSLSLVSFTNKATADNYANYIVIRVYASQLIGNWGITFSNKTYGTTKLTSANWGISKVEIREVDMSGNNAIIENNTINSQNIINNNNENTQDIINNNNENTQQIIEANKVCLNYNYNNNIDKQLGFLTDTGTINTSFSYIYHTSDFIPVNKEKNYQLILNYSTSNPSYCLYNKNYDLISCEKYNNRQNITLTPTQDGYIKYSINLANNTYTTIFKGEFCQNGNQALTDSFTDSSIPTGNDYFDDFNEMLPSNNTISSLITLPISLYTKVLNSINGTCSAISLGSLYNTNLVMPCINLESYLGSTLFGVIDLIMSGGFVLIISKKMVKAFHNFTSMKEGDVINND